MYFSPDISMIKNCNESIKGNPIIRSETAVKTEDLCPFSTPYLQIFSSFKGQMQFILIQPQAQIPSKRLIKLNLFLILINTLVPVQPLFEASGFCLVNVSLLDANIIIQTFLYKYAENVVLSFFSSYSGDSRTKGPPSLKRRKRTSFLNLKLDIPSFDKKKLDIWSSSLGHISL